MLHATGDGKRELIFDREYELTDVVTGRKQRAEKLSLDLKNGDTKIYHTGKTK